MASMNTIVYLTRAELSRQVRWQPSSLSTHSGIWADEAATILKIAGHTAGKGTLKTRYWFF